MKVSYWNRFCPTLFGTGAVEMVGDKAKELGIKKVMVVTESDLIRFKVATKVIDILKTAGYDPVIFDKCKADAPSDICDEGARYAVENGIDGIVAIGGGSSLDTAKAIGIIISMRRNSSISFGAGKIVICLTRRINGMSAENVAFGRLKDSLSQRLFYHESRLKQLCGERV